MKRRSNMLSNKIYIRVLNQVTISKIYQYLAGRERIITDDYLYFNAEKDDIEYIDELFVKIEVNR